MITPILMLGAGRMGGAILEGWARAGAFAATDLVIVDPPALIKRKKDHEEGLGLYGRLNRAAMQLLISGHFDQGLTILRDVLIAVGLRYPATPRRAFWSLVRSQIRLRLRGRSIR